MVKEPWLREITLMSNNIRIASVYRDSLHFIDMMSDKDLARFVRAQVAATLGRPLPGMSKLAKALFDTHNEIEQRFEDARRKRSEDGRKGGNPTLTQPLTQVQSTMTQPLTQVRPNLTQVDPAMTQPLTQVSLAMTQPLTQVSPNLTQVDPAISHGLTQVGPNLTQVDPAMTQPLTQVQPMFNHGSTEVQPTLNHGSTEVQPTLNHGSTEVQPTLNHGSTIVQPTMTQPLTQVGPNLTQVDPALTHGLTQVGPNLTQVDPAFDPGQPGHDPTFDPGQPEFDPAMTHGLTQVQPMFNHGSIEVKPSTLKDQAQKGQDLKDLKDLKDQDLKDQDQNHMAEPTASADGVDHSAVIKQMIYENQYDGQTSLEPDSPSAKTPRRSKNKPDGEVVSLGNKPLQDKRFDEFWAAYPKKVKKALAQKIWRRLKPDTELFSKIINAIEQAKQSDQWRINGGQFIPHPTAWLNGGCWDDEPQPSIQIGGFDYRDTKERSYGHTLPYAKQRSHGYTPPYAEL
jgi:hypothetical protein